MMSTFDAIAYTMSRSGGPLFGASSVLMLLGKITLVLSVGVAAAAITRRAGAATRHAIWTGTLLGVLSLPMLTIGMPTWRLHVLPASPAPPPARQQPMGTRPYDGGKPMPRSLTPGSSNAVPMPVGRESNPGWSRAPEDHAERRLPVTTALWLLWALGVAVGCARLVAGHVGLRRVQRTANRLATEEWDVLLRDERARAGVARPVSLLTSPGVSTPVTWGTRRPVILLPERARAWTDAQRRVALRHELAHVARNDAAAQLGASIACAVYWFHPLVWLAARRMRIECERACDERVVALGTPPTDYAAQLLEIARSARALGDRGLISVAMARPSQLEQRVVAILFARRTDHGMVGRSRAMAGTATALLVVPLAMMQPSARSSEQHAHAPLPVAAVIRPEPSKPEVRATAAVPDSNGTSAPRAAMMHRGGSRSDTLMLSWTDGSRSGTMRVEGKFKLTADGRDVATLSPGGVFTVEERANDTARRVEIRADAAGTLRRTWIVAGAVRPYDHQGEAWLGTTLTTFKRRMGLRSVWPDSTEWSTWSVTRLLQQSNLDSVALNLRRLQLDTLTRALQKTLRDSRWLSRSWSDSLWQRLARQRWRSDSLLERVLQRQFFSDSVLRNRLGRDSLWWTDSLLQKAMRQSDSLVRELEQQIPRP